MDNIEARRDPATGRLLPVDAWTRFARNIAVEDAIACWNWTASTDKDGYGKFHDGQRHVRAHRFAYEDLIGPVARALVMDHLCRNRRCVNPWHLEPVTNRENVRRGVSRERDKTCCPRGHAYTHKKNDGKRRCRTCDNAAQRRSAARRRALNVTP